MKKYNLHIHVRYFLLILLFLGIPASAQDTAFRRVHLAHGISIEIPSHWTVLSQDTRKNIGAAGEAITKNAKVEGTSGKKESLLAVNATPPPTGTIIRISVTTPPDYTQADLAAATPADFKEARTGLFNMLKKLEASGGPKVLEVQPFRIEKINNHFVLVMPYIRAGGGGPSPWQVTQYKIPATNRLIEVTLSYRQSDAAVWMPILEQTKHSLRF